MSSIPSSGYNHYQSSSFPSSSPSVPSGNRFGLSIEIFHDSQLSSQAPDVPQTPGPSRREGRLLVDPKSLFLSKSKAKSEMEKKGKAKSETEKKAIEAVTSQFAQLKLVSPPIGGRLRTSTNS